MSSSPHPMIDALARSLPAPTADDESAGVPSAAVAAILRTPSPGVVEVLLIRRAEHEGDMWSGHIAMPGGKVEPSDRSLVRTAARETLEEVGIDLEVDGELLGALPPLRPRSAHAPQLHVHPYAWHLVADVGLVPNEEVAHAGWVSIDTLRDPSLAVTRAIEIPDGSVRSFSGVQLGDDVLWGITWRVVQDLLGHIDEP